MQLINHLLGGDMITENTIINLRNYFINYFEYCGRLTPTQKNYLKSLKIELIPFNNSGAAGYYSQDEDKIVINTNYKDNFLLYETIFHELDHARCSYVNIFGKRLTGMWTDDNNGSYNKKGDIVTARKGEFLGEGITAINGENVYHSYVDDTEWREVPSRPDGNLFDGHIFPSGLWWYKLNGNFISQFAAVMGINENDFCRMADNGKGRENISRAFNGLCRNKNITFEKLEEKLDYVGTAANLYLQHVYINDNTIKTCQEYIKEVQISLYLKLTTLYQEGRINKQTYIDRFNKFNRYTTIPKLKTILAYKASDNIRAKQ